MIGLYVQIKEKLKRLKYIISNLLSIYILVYQVSSFKNWKMVCIATFVSKLDKLLTL